MTGKQITVESLIAEARQHAAKNYALDYTEMAEIWEDRAAWLQVKLDALPPEGLDVAVRVRSTRAPREARLLRDETGLKVELATLRSPQRIETIAREKLQMTYPGREQVILIK